MLPPLPSSSPPPPPALSPPGSAALSQPSPLAGSAARRWGTCTERAAEAQSHSPTPGETRARACWGAEPGAGHAAAGAHASMGRAAGRTGTCPSHPWVLAAALALITLRESSAETATEWKSQPTKGTNASWNEHLLLSNAGRDDAKSPEARGRSLLSGLEPGWIGTQDAGKESAKAEELQTETLADISTMVGGAGTDAMTLATLNANSFSLEGSSSQYYPSGNNKDSSPASIGPTSAHHVEAGLEVVGAVTPMAWTADRDALAVAFGLTKKVARDTEGVEEVGSGDPRARAPESVLTHPDSAGKEWGQGVADEGTTALPEQSAITELKGLESGQVNQGISPDSAETDLLLGVYDDVALSPPTPQGKSAVEGSQIEQEAEVNFDSEKEAQPTDLWTETTSKSSGQGGQERLDLALLEKKDQPGPWKGPTSPPKTLKPPEPPSDPPSPDIIDIDYYDLFDIDSHGGTEDVPRSQGPGGDATKKLHDKRPSWALSELYDDFTPFDESDFYPTTSFYADGDEDGTNPDDEDEDDVEEVDEGEDEEATARDLGDENGAKPLTFTPKIPTMAREEKPTGRQHVPQHTIILSGADMNPKSQPDANKDLTQTMAGGNETGSECRTGYVRFNSSCRSVCDMYPMYCYNSGQCYLVDHIGAFCRCNTQDYIWHKGLRCESIITDFQVMCVAVGAAALVVLLLFMMTVFFAKKLYLLKTENYKLRKRHRYRTPSELHNDNFSLSTIAEGSHPNEDPSAPHKLQEPPRSVLKDDEGFNIQNSLSPKAESEKCGQDSPEVNCLQNNLT
ncbi:chondroitin sulfate proteoglycan 5 isoform X3 [Ambystoma mexicanum]|uniref:chondroitin sulfate proteoglycan 5 isoform X3 n=1 Tax=Ambystoma mexicanum TaxID=8296 RepID=UPI0037E7BA48